MPANIEIVTDTKRRITFTLLESDVDTEILVRLKSLQKTTTLPGFRRGKAPLKMIDTRFRSDVKAEVLNDLVSLQVDQTLQEQAVPVYSRPYVEKLSNDNGGDYDISVSFETYPEFTKRDIKGEWVEIPALEMSEADYDKRLEELREYFHDWQQVERKPLEGDYVTLNWVNASQPDSALDDAANRIPVRVGEAEPAEVQDALLDLDIGEIKVIEIAAPQIASNDDSDSPESQQFKMRIESVSMPLKEKFSKDALINLFGVESEDDDRLRERLKLFVSRESKAAIHRVKEIKVKDLLLAANETNPPESAVTIAFADLLARSGVDKEKALLAAAQEEQPDQLRQMKQTTRERLKFTWIVQEIATGLGLTGERRDELAEQMLREEAEDFPNPEQAYTEMLPVTRQYEEICITRNVVDFLLEDANVQTIPMNYWDLIKLDNELKESDMNVLPPVSTERQPEAEVETEIDTAESVIVDAYGNPIRS